jgi:hypothetical protein
MDVAFIAVAALDEHLGIVGVASMGMGFLMNLAVAPENHVIP